MVTIKAQDKFRNAHTSGGAIICADIKLITSIYDLGVSYTPSQQHLLSAPNTECEVQDNNDGTYRISARVNIAGRYSLNIDQTKRLCFINVTSGIPCPANFQLLQSNIYEMPVSVSRHCDISMYDQFHNPCSVHGWLDRVAGKVVTPSAEFEIAPLSRERFLSKNVFSFGVVTREMGLFELTVYFNGEQLSFCPIQYTILQENFRERVTILRFHINRQAISLNPTFTVNRENLLESSMNMLMLHPQYFKQRFHVRFGAEPGVDAGGVAK